MEKERKSGKESSHLFGYGKEAGKGELLSFIGPLLGFP